MTAAETSFSPDAPLGRVSTVDALTAMLRRRILTGAEEAGAPLREAELCDHYRVSRHSLRTALQPLIHSGLLTHAPNRGVYVSTLTPEDIVDIYALREVLEIEAVKFLASEPRRAEPAELALAELDALPQDAPWPVVRDHDLAFHQGLVEGLGRPRTSRTFSSLLDELRLAFLQLRPELENPGEVARDHRQVIDAIVDRDEQRATDLIRSHLQEATHNIAASLTKLGH